MAESLVSGFMWREERAYERGWYGHGAGEACCHTRIATYYPQHERPANQGGRYFQLNIKEQHNAQRHPND